MEKSGKNYTQYLSKWRGTYEYFKDSFGNKRTPKDWTKTEVEKLSEFMEHVIIETMVVNKLPIHVVTKSF